LSVICFLTVLTRKKVSNSFIAAIGSFIFLVLYTFVSFLNLHFSLKSSFHGLLLPYCSSLFLYL
jgi:hypothetical protein